MVAKGNTEHVTETNHKRKIPAGKPRVGSLAAIVAGAKLARAKGLADDIKAFR